MTVVELLAEIAEMMPGAATTPKAMERWTPVYFRVLKDHEGAKLRAGWDKLLEGWIYSRAPRPAEILDVVKNTRGSRTGRLYGDLTNDQLEKKIAFWRDQSVGEYGLRMLEAEANHRKLLL